MSCSCETSRRVPAHDLRRRWPATASRVLLVILALGLPSAVGAQEVTWRYDYNAARKEAEDKNRPLIIDFGTEDCVWCKRLDASTFHDATVASMLNEKFIP